MSVSIDFHYPLSLSIKGLYSIGPLGQSPQNIATVDGKIFPTLKKKIPTESMHYSVFRTSGTPVLLVARLMFYFSTTERKTIIKHEFKLINRLIFNFLVLMHLTL